MKRMSRSGVERKNSESDIRTECTSNEPRNASASGDEPAGGKASMTDELSRDGMLSKSWNALISSAGDKTRVHGEETKQEANIKEDNNCRVNCSFQRRLSVMGGADVGVKGADLEAFRSDSLACSSCSIAFKLADNLTCS